VKLFFRILWFSTMEANRKLSFSNSLKRTIYMVIICSFFSVNSNENILWRFIGLYIEIFDYH